MDEVKIFQAFLLSSLQKQNYSHGTVEWIKAISLLKTNLKKIRRWQR